MNMKHRVLKGDEMFTFGTNTLQANITDFWAWSMSRLLADGPRGDLAEFIVNTALGIDTTIPKKGWGECDILYDGMRIEVKCSSALQAWDRKSPPRPTFSISKTANCDIQETKDGFVYVGSDGSEPQRRSECYVFCYFAHTDRETANPMRLEQWEFYILPTSVINENLGNQKSISLQGIKRLNGIKVDYNGIKPQIDLIKSRL